MAALVKTGEEPTTVYYGHVSQMNDEELKAGNTSFCHTPEVLCQARYERSLKERLAEDKIDKVLKVRDAWQNSLQKDPI